MSDVKYPEIILLSKILSDFQSGIHSHCPQLLKIKCWAFTVLNCWICCLGYIFFDGAEFFCHSCYWVYIKYHNASVILLHHFHCVYDELGSFLIVWNLILKEEVSIDKFEAVSFKVACSKYYNKLKPNFLHFFIAVCKLSAFNFFWWIFSLFNKTIYEMIECLSWMNLVPRGINIFLDLISVGVQGFHQIFVLNPMIP